MRNAWADGEPETVDESTFTHGCERGWTAWNGWSPEREFCEGVAEIVLSLKPDVVIETGVGQGFTTRRVLEAIGPDTSYLGFESDRKMFDQLPHGHPEIQFVFGHPDAPDYESADLVIFDSLGKLRRTEIRLWYRSAKPGSHIICHDVDPSRPGTPHYRNSKLIEKLGVEGVLTPNPRGGFFGHR